MIKVEDLCYWMFKKVFLYSLSRLPLIALNLAKKDAKSYF